MISIPKQAPQTKFNANCPRRVCEEGSALRRGFRQTKKRQFVEQFLMRIALKPLYHCWIDLRWCLWDLYLEESVDKIQLKLD